MNDDEPAASSDYDSGLKREAETSPAHRPSHSKKPRDNRLRDCFTITPIEGGGENIVCNHCPDYRKTLQKFNPTKARSHLTDTCPGVDPELRQILLSTTQAAKKGRNLNQAGEADFDALGYSPATAFSAPESASAAKPRKVARGRYRPSPAYMSFHAGDTSLDVTAPVENEVHLLRLAFPTNLKLNFVAETNIEGAAMCIEGFMNKSDDAVWSASLYSMTSEGTRSEPHCQWSLCPEASGSFEDGMMRVQKIQQLLKTLVVS